MCRLRVQRLLKFVLRPGSPAVLCAAVAAVAPSMTEAARGTARGAAGAALDTIPGVAVQCTDFRGGPALEVQAQRIFASGERDPAWSPVGTRLCIGTSSGSPSRSIPDGAGGAFVIWVDQRSGDADIYAQRFTAAGAVAPGWPGDAIVVSAGPGGQQEPDVCADGAGGVIIAWQDYRSGATADIYAQRLSGSGNLLWAPNGRAICTHAEDQATPGCLSDGAGGALIAWSDAREGAPRIFGAHVPGAQGAEPVAAELAPAPAAQLGLRLVPDAAGGGYLVWSDHRSGIANLFALRVSATGGPIAGWPSSGLALAPGAGEQSPFDVIALPESGCVVAWCDRSSGNGDIRAQRVLPDGSRAWGAAGVLVSGELTEEFAPALVQAENLSVIVAWEDHRDGAGDIHSQRLRTDGTAAWPAAGVAVCRLPGEQFGVTLTSDGAGGAVATWLDAVREGRASLLRRQPALDGAVPRLMGTEVGPGRAKLTWRTSPGDARPLQLNRQAGKEDWRPLRTLVADASGELVGEDRTVPAGVSATYRLSFETADGEMLYEDVHLVIPAPMPLALAWARADGRGLRVAFTLSTNDDAAMEILDVQGRRVWRDEVGRFGAGHHELQLPFTGHSGLYFVRLHQGGQTRTQRAVVIR